MRTARSSSRREGGLHTDTPWTRHPPPRPGTLPLWTEFLTHATEDITLPQT